MGCVPADERIEKEGLFFSHVLNNPGFAAV
jgi:hypothetical protein